MWVGYANAGRRSRHALEATACKFSQLSPSHHRRTPVVAKVLQRGGRWMCKREGGGDEREKKGEEEARVVLIIFHFSFSFLYKTILLN